MISITGLYESHLTVSDLDRSIDFYRVVVGLELAHTIPDRHVVFFWVGGRDRSNAWIMVNSSLANKHENACRFSDDARSDYPFSAISPFERYHSPWFWR